MKKFLIVLISAFLVSSLMAATHEPEAESEFAAYQAEQNQENFIAAANNFYQAIAEDKDSQQAQIMLGYLLSMELERNLAAIAEQAESLDTGLKFNYANLLLSLNRFEESLVIYDQLNADFGQWSCPWRHKGEAYLKMGQLGKAEEATQISIDVREDHYDAYIQLAEVQKLLGKNATALKSIEKGVSLMDEKG
ncbi:MAG: hypothetical protein R6U84_02150 [Candidatus Cloacimonadales bacterium]